MKKRIFLVSTEKKRVPRKICYYVSEIKENGIELIDNDTKTNHFISGASAVIRSILIKTVTNILASKGIHLEEEGFMIIHVDCSELGYTNQINV